MNFKRLISCFFASTAVLSLLFAGIDKKYEHGYTVEHSDAGNGGELFISPYKDGKFIFQRNDTVYECTIDTTKTDIANVKVCQDFKNISISGLVAYDTVSKKLYYSDLDPSRI